MTTKNKVSIGAFRPMGDVEIFKTMSKEPREYVGLHRPFYDQLLKAADAAKHALRSYQYGNGATDLAQSTADMLEAVLFEARESERQLKEWEPISSTSGE